MENKYFYLKYALYYILNDIIMWIFIHWIFSRINGFSPFHLKNNPNPYNSLKEPILWTTVIMQLLNVIIVGDIIVIKFYCERMWVNPMSINVKIIRSNRKTLSIELKPNEIIARAPIRMKEKEIYKFIES